MSPVSKLFPSLVAKGMDHAMNVHLKEKQNKLPLGYCCKLVSTSRWCLRNQCSTREKEQILNSSSQASFQAEAGESEDLQGFAPGLGDLCPSWWGHSSGGLKNKRNLIFLAQHSECLSGSKAGLRKRV